MFLIRRHLRNGKTAIQGRRTEEELCHDIENIGVNNILLLPCPDIAELKIP